ncbi:hypothetical protein JYU34_007214 [Plutella xylostella]|uniref:PHD-type domain-containing protein n=1 Tax=Plutella xylostella TaxID=51655 RepID=A0ABQ7QPV7_PLUXY|nr:hypothetical protein JYU34_014092 [Plutella xylostella]KAG7307079.1 hypothetical protein JYU34_007214 [Plutella xylostella]
MDCEACQQKIKAKQPFIVCTTQGCGKHYHIACTTTSQSAPIDTNTWICQDCICAKKKGGDNSATPVRSAPSNITQRQGKPKSKVEVPIDDYANEIRLLRKEMGKITESVAEVLKSMKTYNERLDKIDAKLDSTDTRLKVLETQRDTEIAELKATISELKIESNNFHQAALKNDLEIIGLPETRSENLVHAVLVMSQKLGVNLSESDINGVNRVGPRLGLQDLGGQKIGRPSHRPVVVTLLRKVQRDNFLKSAKTRRNLTTKDLEMEGPAHQLYINERLTYATRQLFRAARARNKSTGLYKHCWVSGGRLYLRKLDGSPALSIGSHDELEQRFSGAKCQTGTHGTPTA